MYNFIVCVILLSGAIDVALGALTRLPAGMSLHKGSVTWHEARDQCEREGGVIASPINSKALSAMKSVIGEHNITYFIGIKATDLPGQFVSVEGVALEDMPLAVTLDMIQELNRQEGECLAMSRDGIRVMSCWSELPYMCYETHTFNVKKSNCGPEEDGYKYNIPTERCYKIQAKWRTWEQAHWTCAAEGAYLTIIEDETKAQTIKDMVNNIYPTEDYIFIGRRKVIGTSNWKSIHGQPVEELYNEVVGNRSPSDSEFQCGGLHSSGKWQYIRCTAGLIFICEKEPTM